MRHIIFVFSYFPGAKVSAWSTYTPSTTDQNGNRTQFTIETAVVFGKRVFLRAGNRVYVFGGTGPDPQYDGTECTAQLPYLDAGRPAAIKRWQGVDAAVMGEWAVDFGQDANTPAAFERPVILYSITFNELRIPFTARSSHITLRCRSRNFGYARLGSIILHYEGSLKDD